MVAFCSSIIVIHTYYVVTIILTSAELSSYNLLFPSIKFTEITNTHTHKSVAINTQYMHMFPYTCIFIEYLQMQMGVCL